MGLEPGVRVAPFFGSFAVAQRELNSMEFPVALGPRASPEGWDIACVQTPQPRPF
jgi:hypothetical protein